MKLSDLEWHTERRKISSLIPYEQNPRTMTKKQADDLRKSLEKFNLVEIPAVNTDDRIIAGHQRLRIMQMTGRGEEEVEVRIPNRELTEEEFREYNIRSNKNTGSWDYSLLANEFNTSDLVEWGFDEKELGITQEPVDAEPQIDRAEELNKKWQVKTGDLFSVGSHRLLCGDSTKAEDVERVMGGKKAEVVLTDPPYGINWDTDYTRFTTEYGTKRINHPSVQGDDKEFDPTPWLDFPQVILWGANWYCQKIPVGTWLVWDKRHPSGSAWLSDAELGWMKGKRGVYIYSDTVQGAHRKEQAQHPTQKPVGLMCWCIERFGKTETIIDPFLGSGTTMVACQNLNRKCRGIEISPAYCAVILERMAMAFPDLKIERIE